MWLCFERFLQLWLNRKLIKAAFMKKTESRDTLKGKINGLCNVASN